MNLEEQWKIIIDYPNYMISNFGNVKNRKGSLLKPDLSGSYLRVALSSLDKKRKKYLFTD